MFCFVLLWYGVVETWCDVMCGFSGMVWCGLVLYGMVWCSVVCVLLWYGMVLLRRGVM